jgi:thioredoxin-related protein
MDENINDAFEKLNVLSIPAVFLYDREGRLRYNLNGDDPNHQFTEKELEDAVARLAAQGYGKSPARRP